MKQQARIGQRITAIFIILKNTERGKDEIINRIFMV